MGKPRERKIVNVNFRLTLQEWQDLNKATIAEKTTKAGFLRAAVKKCKRKHQAKGDWPREVEQTSTEPD